MVADMDPEDDEANIHVLNVGFGLGIVRFLYLFVDYPLIYHSSLKIDTLFQSLCPARHVIIEAHPDVLAHMRTTGWPFLSLPRLS